jgi:N-acetylneuraminic acid mutarotase
MLQNRVAGMTVLLALFSAGALVAQGRDIVWDPEVRLNYTSYSENNYWSCQNHVAVDPAGRVHVVWYVQIVGNPYPFQIYYKRYTPGSGWSSDTVISDDRAAAGYNNKYPSLAVDSTGRVWVIWGSSHNTDGTDRICYRTCVPAGANGGWDPASSVVSTTDTTIDKESPNLAGTPDGRVHAVWRETSPSGIAYREYTGGGWQPVVNLDANGIYKVYPSIAAARNGNLYLVYHGYPLGGSGYYRIWYKARVGGNWQTSEDVTALTQHQMYPHVTVNPVSSEPHVVWTYNATRTKILHSFRTGGVWQPLDTLSRGDTASQSSAQIAFTADGTGHAVWSGKPLTRNRVQVRHAERSPAGVWSVPGQLTDTTGSKERPSIAHGNCNPLDVNVVWSDSRNTGYDMYYIHGGPDVAHDVGVRRVVAPTGILDSGAAVTPACTVYNYGSNSESYAVKLRIGAGGSDSVLVSGHGSGVARYITFPVWTASTRGRFAVTCSTGLSGDERPGNDRRDDSCLVRVLDAAVLSIAAPSDTVDSGVAVTPQVVVKNQGNTTVSFDVKLCIGADSAVSRAVAVTPDSQRSVSFPGWMPAARGTVSVSCTTRLSGDVYSRNDRQEKTALVRVLDAAAQDIRVPEDSAKVNTQFTPQARIANLGNTVVVLLTHFIIRQGTDTIYRQSSGLTTFEPGETLTVSYPSDSIAVRGWYAVTCWTELAGDAQPGNDAVSDSFLVYDPRIPPSGWARMADVPAGPRGRRVKDGGCLAPDTFGFYALKGNNTCEYYRYNTPLNTWDARESIPAVGSSGRKKAVKKGGALTAATGSFYATKGNGTLEFWQYTPGRQGAYPWQQLTDVPQGTRSVKEGAGLAGVEVNETTYVYLLKGSGTQEFYRCNPATGVWQAMASAPLGASGKAFKAGSGICFDPDERVIRALKGTYNEFFAYSVDSNRWEARNGLPFTGSSGRKRKGKDGAGLAFDLGATFALKGGNTNEFWSFVADTGPWQQLPDMPEGAGKRVKGGGAIAAGYHAVYALRGNNTLEFWRYGLGGLAAGYRSDGVVLSRVSNLLGESRVVLPTVVRTVLMLPPESGTAPRFVLRNISGREVCDLHPGANDLGRLGPGVYFVAEHSVGAARPARVSKVIVTR